MTENQIHLENEKTLEVPKHKSFPTLLEAHAWANNLIGQGVQMQASRVWSDRFKSAQPRSHVIKLLGVEKRADAVCQRLAPGGQWNVEIETPGSEYPHAGILDFVTMKTKHFRCSAWYNRFLPYAYAMINSEHGFKCFGIDYECINSYYGTCLGFVSIGQGDTECASDSEYWRIVKEDVDLFQTLYSASGQVRAPQLPFDEALNPCCCFVAMRAPQLLVKSFGHVPECWVWEHVQAVAELLNLPRIQFRFPRQRKVA